MVSAKQQAISTPLTDLQVVIIEKETTSPGLELKQKLPVKNTQF
jgi:hypothetical protein